MAQALTDATPGPMEVHKVTRFRIMVSGLDNDGFYHVLAAKIEDILDARGSSVQPQQGRWHGDVEIGVVIEISVPGTYWPGRIHLFGSELKDELSRWGLTAYVTADHTEAMEVY